MRFQKTPLFTSTFLSVGGMIIVMQIVISNTIRIIAISIFFFIGKNTFAHTLEDKFYLVCDNTQGYDNYQNIYFDVSFLPKESFIIDEKNKKITSLNGYEYKIKTFTNEELSFSIHVRSWDILWMISRVDGSYQKHRNTDTLNISPYLSYKGQCVKKQDTSF